MKKEIHILRMKNDKLKKLKKDHNNNGQTQLENNKSIDKHTNNLMQSSSMIIEGCIIKNTSEMQEYHTGEEELAWETSNGRSLPKRRAYKKQKAASSPEDSAEPAKMDKPEKWKITQNKEQGTIAYPSTSGKTTDKKKVKFPPFNLIHVK